MYTLRNKETKELIRCTPCNENFGVWLRQNGDYPWVTDTRLQAEFALKQSAKYMSWADYYSPYVDSDINETTYEVVELAVI